MARKIIGAVGLNGTVYRAGQEKEMEAAAKEAKVDLSDERFAGALEDSAPAKKAEK